jgi:hypothetical protein
MKIGIHPQFVLPKMAFGLGQAPPGCVLYLPGILGGSGKILDRSAFGNHGAINGATWVRLPSGIWALSFNGVDDYVDAGNKESLNLTSQGTIELWVYVNSYGTNYPSLIQKGNSAGWLAGTYLIYRHITNNFYSGVISDGVTGKTAVFPTVSLGSWHHLVFTWNGTQLIAYTDAVAGTPNTQTLNAAINTTNLWIGKSSAQGFDGKIAEVRLYNRALSALEIARRFEESKIWFK